MTAVIGTYRGIDPSKVGVPDNGLTYQCSVSGAELGHIHVGKGEAATLRRTPHERDDAIRDRRPENTAVGAPAPILAVRSRAAANSVIPHRNRAVGDINR